MEGPGAPPSGGGAARLLGSDPVLVVHDLERSAAWYRDALGCTVDDVDGTPRLEPPTDQPWCRRELVLRSPDGHRFNFSAVIQAQPAGGTSPVS